MEVAKTGRCAGQLEFRSFYQSREEKGSTDRHNDKRKFFDHTLEQFTCAGIGNSRFDLCYRRLIHLDMDGTEWHDRAGAYRGTLLTGCRISYSHAVRMASEKLSSRRFS
jgi:hypothetical protein